MANTVISEGPFSGLDAATLPEFLGAGLVTVADNAEFDRGLIATRPGFRAQLTEALPGPLSQAFSFVRDDGTAHLLFVDGNGRLRRFQEGDATAEFDGLSWETFEGVPQPFDTLKVQFVRLDDYIFIAGATGANAGKLFRYQISSRVLDDTAGLTKPTQIIAASASSSVIASLTAGKSDYLPNGAMPVPDNDFAASSETTQTPPALLSPAWRIIAGPVEMHRVDGKTWLYLDSPSGGIESVDYLPVPQKVNETGTGDEPRYPVHFRLAYSGRIKRFQTIDVTLVGYDADNIEVAAQTLTIKAKDDADSSGSLPNVPYLDFDLSPQLADDTTLTKLKLRLLGGPTNDSEVTNGALLTDLALSARAGIGTELAFLHQAFDLGEMKDLSAVGRIAVLVDYSTPLLTDLRARLGFRSAGDVSFIVSDLMATGTDGQGRTFLSVDISGLASSLTAVRFVDFIYDADPDTGAVVPSFAANPSQLMNAGRLSIGYVPYTWRITEKSALVNADVSSPAGPLTSAVSPTKATAQGKLVFAQGPVNQYTTFEVWRSGGTFTDGNFRLVASFDPENSSAGAMGTGPYGSGSWSWDADMLTFTDNVSDLTLQGAEILVDHDSAPFTADNPARAVAIFAGRVAVGTQTRLYLSQAQTGARIGLYWNLSNDFNAPNVAEQGFNVRLPDVGGGKAVRLVPHLTRLMCLMERALFLFGGNDPLDFALRRLELDSGDGAVGPNAVITTAGNLLCQVKAGLRQVNLESWNGDASAAVALEVGPLLTPTPSPVLCLHDNRLFVSTADGVLVCDLSLLQRPWSRWLLSGVRGVVSGQVGLFVLTAAGQIFKIEAGIYGDTPTHDAEVQPVEMTVRGRGMGLDLFESDAVNLIVRLFTDEDNRTAKIRVLGGLANTEQPYQLRRRYTIARVKPGVNAQGLVMQWEVSATAERALLSKVVFELAERRRL